MKTIITFFAAVLITVTAFAQAPAKMSYQAVIRNANGALVTSSNVSMRISILQGSTTGPVSYQQTTNATTNVNGLVSLIIGEGMGSHNFDLIDWANGPYFIKVETDPQGGNNYSVVSVSQLMSTPYALYAATSGSSTPGPQGPQGEQGPAGPKGDAGKDGKDGATGATGPQGIQGVAGPQGARGFTGVQGPIGLTGAQGLKGDTGDKGDKGDTGLKGDKGDTGDKGDKGDKGDTGEKGDKGDMGAQGLKGDTGATGAQGPIGLTGPQGLKGDTGDKGDKGDTGLKGDKGDTGEKGVKGDTGLKGDKGDTGDKGDKGDTGATGLKGDTGDKGDKGDKGDTGEKGDPGADGITGATGADGLTTSVNNVQQVNGNVTLTPADISLGNVDNTADVDKPISTATQTALDLKANLDSPELIGTPTAPTATAGDSSAQLATTAFVTSAVSSSVNGNYLPTIGGTLTGGLTGTSATFSKDATVNGITIGKGNFSSTFNTAVGKGALASNNQFSDLNTAIGFESLYRNTAGEHNSSFGSMALTFNTLGSENTAGGAQTLYYNTTGERNTGFGVSALTNNETGSQNTAVGHVALNENISGSYNTAIGSEADVASGGLNNATAIGYAAKVGSSNTIQLGNGDVTLVNTSGDITSAGTITANAFAGDGSSLTNVPVADNSITSSKIVSSVALSGAPTTNTASVGDSSTKIATTAFVMNAASLKSIVASAFVTLNSTYSGKVIPTQWGGQPIFPEDLPDGFTCDIINYSNFTFTSNTLSVAKFFSKTTGWGSGTGASSFTIPSGATVRINVVTIGTTKCYFIMN